jgi:hypothetical protein
MCILAELDTQRKALHKKGEDVPSHMVEPSLEDTQREEEVHQCASVHGGVPGPQGLGCQRMGGRHVFHPTTADETMTKLALENMWWQWHAAPGSMETKERGRYTWQGTNQKGMGWLQEGIDWYNKLFKEAALNQKESQAIEFEMDVVESLKERHYQNASLDEIQQLTTRKRCKLGAVDGELRKKAETIWDESKIVAV